MCVNMASVYNYKATISYMNQSNDQILEPEVKVCLHELRMPDIYWDKNLVSVV